MSGNTAPSTAALITPVSPAIPAPNANASNFSRFTGMLIASAARGSGSGRS